MGMQYLEVLRDGVGDVRWPRSSSQQSATDEGSEVDMNRCKALGAHGTLLTP